MFKLTSALFNSLSRRHAHPQQASASAASRRSGIKLRLGAAAAVTIALIYSTQSSTAHAAQEQASTTQIEKFQDMAVTVSGQGLPVVMIPGLNSSASVWDSTCAALQAKMKPQSVQCHQLHLPGFAGLPAVKTDHFMTAMRDRILAYVEAKNLKKPVLMGHSLGGGLANMLAITAPQRFERVVIVDSLPFFMAWRDPSTTVHSAKPMVEQMAAQMTQSTDEQKLAFAKQSAPTMAHSQADQQRVIDMGMSSDTATTAQAIHDFWLTDLREDLSRVQAPTLVLGAWAAYAPMGSTMDSTRKIYETQYAKLKGVQVRMSEKGYHFLMWDDTDWLVSEVAAFLKQSS